MDTVFVHTYPMKTITKNGTFEKRSPEWIFLKTLFSRDVWTDETTDHDDFGLDLDGLALGGTTF